MPDHVRAEDLAKVLERVLFSSQLGRFRIDRPVWDPCAARPRSPMELNRTRAVSSYPAYRRLAVMFGDVADSDPRDEAADRGVRTSVIVEVDEPRERQEAPGV